jgi:hypothetical protein
VEESEQGKGELGSRGMAESEPRKATPAWANQAKIAALYEEAQTLSGMMGEPCHVDHIVPLKSKIVCGLHCEANLQILPGLENMKKGNRVWPDMP